MQPLHLVPSTTGNALTQPITSFQLTPRLRGAQWALDGQYHCFTAGEQPGGGGTHFCQGLTGFLKNIL